MSPRIYTRKFDWDEARVRHAAGATYAVLAREYGVSPMAVARVCDERIRERMRATLVQHQHSGTCRDCGRTGVTPRYGRCQLCAGLVRATSARPDELECVTCRQWKPDDSFTKGGNVARRGRHKQCKSCMTAAKRDWRARNREYANAYDREYKRLQRGAA